MNRIFQKIQILLYSTFLFLHSCGTPINDIENSNNKIFLQNTLQLSNNSPNNDDKDNSSLSDNSLNNGNINHNKNSLGKESAIVIDVNNINNNGDSATVEDVFEAMKRVEEILQQNEDDIKQLLSNINVQDRIFGISDTEGKYFIIYACLRMAGMVKAFDFNNPKFIEYDLNKKTFRETTTGKFSSYQQNLSSREYRKVFYDKTHDVICFPKLEINDHWEATCIHLGDIVDRGRNSIICLLTLLYLKQNLKKGRLILVAGNHELGRYPLDLPQDIFRRNKKPDDKIRTITLGAMAKNQMSLFDTVTIGGEDVLLSHTEMNDNELRYLNKSTSQKILNKDFFYFLPKLNDESSVYALTNYGKWHQITHVKNANENDNFPYSVICGHLHRPLSLDKGEGLSDNKGCFFKKNNGKCILYFDNYSTDALKPFLSKQNKGRSKASIHIIDKTKNIVTGHEVIEVFDKINDNFKINTIKPVPLN